MSGKLHVLIAGRRPVRPGPGPGPDQGRAYLRGLRARRRRHPQDRLLPAHERRRRRGASPLPAGGPVRAVRADLAPDLRPARVGRPGRPAQRAELAAAPGAAERGRAPAHRRPPADAARHPAGPAGRFLPPRPARHRLPGDTGQRNRDARRRQHGRGRRPGRRGRHPLGGPRAEAPRHHGHRHRRPRPGRLRPHAADPRAGRAAAAAPVRGRDHRRGPQGLPAAHRGLPAPAARRRTRRPRSRPT